MTQNNSPSFPPSCIGALLLLLPFFFLPPTLAESDLPEPPVDVVDDEEEDDDEEFSPDALPASSESSLAPPTAPELNLAAMASTLDRFRLLFPSELGWAPLSLAGSSWLTVPPALLLGGGLKRGEAVDSLDGLGVP